MNILSVAWECTTGWFGGLGMFLTRLLPEMVSLGHKVIHICTQGSHFGCIDLGYKECRYIQTVISKDSGVGISTAVVLAATAIPYIWDSDAVIVHDFHASLVALFSSEQGKKCFIYIHMPSGLGIELDAIRTCRSATNSMFMSRHIESIYGVKTDVIYPAPPYRAIDIDEKKFYTEEPTILILTRYQSNKDPKWILDILSKLRESGYRFRTVLAGRLVSLYRYHIDMPWITALDDIPEDMKIDLIKKSYIVVNPSRWEPFGLVALESIALGTPVLTHRNTGAAEAIQYGVVDEENIEEVLKNILTDPKEAIDLLERQRKQPIMYRTWRDVAREIMEKI